jgi:hypothetical protein
MCRTKGTKEKVGEVHGMELMLKMARLPIKFSMDVILVSIYVSNPHSCCGHVP